MKKSLMVIPIFILASLFTFSVFASQVTVTPRLSISEEYSDNLFLSDEDKEEDFITSVTPGFTVELLGQLSGAEMSYDPSYSFYSEFDEYNAWRHDAKLSGWIDMTKFTRLEIANSFLYTEDPLRDADETSLRAADPTRQTDTTVRRSRETYYTNTANAKVIHQFGERNTMVLGYTYRFQENDSPEYQDYIYHGPSLAVTYWISERWGLDTDVSYTRGEFDRDELGDSEDTDIWKGAVRIIRPFTQQLNGFLKYTHTMNQFDGDTEEDYQVYNPAVGFDYQAGEDVVFSIDVGYFISDYDDKSDETGLTANGRLTKRFQRGTLNLIGGAGYEDTYFSAERLGFSQYYEFGMSGTYDFFKNVTGDVFGFYRNDDYKDYDPSREDDTLRVGAGIRVIPLQWMAVRLEYSYREVDSTDSIEDYEENRGMLSVTLIPPTPYRIK